jgi:hypothetical protein
MALARLGTTVFQSCNRSLVGRMIHALRDSAPMARLGTLRE